jgi:predicted metal-binding transcription factor (methanogenesis marker protein 9)
MEYLLFERSTKIVPKREELIKEYQLVPEQYQDLLDRLRDDILTKSNYETTVISIESMSEEIERQKCKQMK